MKPTLFLLTLSWFSTPCGFGTLLDLSIVQQLNSNQMKSLSQQYEQAKKKAYTLMQKGNISAYVKALAEMNSYKNKMTLIIAN